MRTARGAAARTRTGSGHVHSGAYGGSGPLQELAGADPLYFTVDANKCSDADDIPLEGTSVAPGIVVEAAVDALAP